MTEENKINTLPMPLGGNANINIVIEGPTCPIVLKILRTHNTLKYFLQYINQQGIRIPLRKCIDKAWVKRIKIHWF